MSNRNMNRRWKMRRLLFGVSVWAAAWGLPACGQNAATTVGSEPVQTPMPRVTQAPTVAPEPEMPILGKKAEGDGVYCVEITNETGKDIVTFLIEEERPADNAEEGALEGETEQANMLSEKEVFSNGETRLLYFSPEEVGEKSDNAGQSEASADDIPILSPLYNIILTTDDSLTMTLHAFPFEDIESGSIRVDENGLAYLEYTAKESGDQVSTLEAERAILAAQTEEVAQEEIPAEEEEYVEEVHEGYYEETNDYGGWDAQSGGGAAVDPNEGCLNGDGMTYGGGGEDPGYVEDPANY